MVVVNLKVTRIISLGMVLLSALVTACGPAETKPTVSADVAHSPIPVETTTVPPVPTSTPSLTATTNAAPRSTVTQDYTATNLPAISTPTATITSTPSNTLTPHPIATLTQLELIQRFDFLGGSPDCQPPCWNGLTPGLSTAGEVRGFYACLGVDLYAHPPFTADEVVFHYYIGFMDNSDVAVYWENNVVSKIEIGRWRGMALFPPDRIARVLGPPDLIRLGIYGEKSDYAVYFLYTERNMVVVISGFGNYVSTRKPTTEICLWDTNEQYLDAFLYRIPR